MECVLGVDGDDDGVVVSSLADWLRREDGLHGRVRLAPEPPEPGEMGSTLDVVSVAVGSGGLLTVLASSLQVWLEQRRKPTTLTVTRPDGTKVKLVATDPDLIEQTLQECLLPNSED